MVHFKGRRGITFQITNSSQVLAEDVTIHAGGNMGFHENYGASSLHAGKKTIISINTMKKIPSGFY